MADAFYQIFRNAILGNVVHSLPDLNTDTIKVILRDEGADALNLADEDLADIVAGSRIATSAAVGSPTVGTVAVGTFDHADVTFTAVTGASVESLDYFKDSGTEATSPLVCNIDSATGLPVTPNGGNITWAPNASGVFQIA
ncbi:MAG: hypothetical protein M3N43_03250 [Actinomycetota bacterium]|nr:hypothetical protein [Actinomycetota bacterium]